MRSTGRAARGRIGPRQPPHSCACGRRRGRCRPPRSRTGSARIRSSVPPLVLVPVVEQRLLERLALHLLRDLPDRVVKPLPARRLRVAPAAWALPAPSLLPLPRVWGHRTLLCPRPVKAGGGLECLDLLAVQSERAGRLVLHHFVEGALDLLDALDHALARTLDREIGRA